jgi:hypothetical protein
MLCFAINISCELDCKYEIPWVLFLYRQYAESAILDQQAKQPFSGGTSCVALHKEHAPTFTSLRNKEFSEQYFDSREIK